MNSGDFSNDQPASSRLHGWLLAIGFVGGVVLLGRLAFDLAGLGWWMAIPIFVFYGSFVALGASNILAAIRAQSAPGSINAPARTALALVIPIAYLASVFDCMGLSFSGCTPTCDFLTNIAVPIAGALAILYLVTKRAWLLTIASTFSFVFFIPNCVCRNPANAFWMDLIERSPACFAGSNGIALLALAALRTRRLVAPTLAVTWIAVAAMLAFFVGHHYFNWPW